ncbi:dienelactone hydrolase family protein [Allohahella marinimesophila]|uniref:Lipase n=1 Tax=Allohahella marinimesophila TaxID=1054972 RepID=A0ABP7NZJ2_9GAMM
MMNTVMDRFTVAASALLFSASAWSFTPTPDPDPDPNPNPEPCQVDCDFTRGPDPTSSYLEASSGPYSVRTIDVSRSVNGFGGGTIHYPSNTTGKMGAIAIVPGFAAPESSIAWWGPRLASHGFVVITIATNSSFDQPASRATQLGSALDYVISQSNSSTSAISGMVDSTRVGAMGWSMGGGGALRLASGARLSAAIPLAPWHSGSNPFDQIETPTMIIACENDSTAPVGSHASPFYNRIPASTDKAFLEINNGSHSCANGGGSNGGLLGKYGVSWMKRFIDKDTRYQQFLCGPNHAGNSAISEYRDTCTY